MSAFDPLRTLTGDAIIGRADLPPVLVAAVAIRTPTQEYCDVDNCDRALLKNRPKTKVKATKSDNGRE
jgi:hypothetical protein